MPDVVIVSTARTSIGKTCRISPGESPNPNPPSR